MKVMKQKNPLGKFITNAEAYLEPLQIFTMELFGLTVFAKKLHHRLRLCNGRRFLKVAFSKIVKISQEIIILENSFSKVVGLKETCNSYFV